jgi:acetolactate synthase-1/2/3 large subunit
MPRRAADLLVDCLAAHGVDRVFCVPGESYLAALDALHDSNAIETVICRHEGGAGFAALGDAKLTGQPGVAFVSRGPGATNASIAVHVAEQDAVPLVLFIGQVPRSEIGRRSFQEVDYAKTFSDMAKGVYVIQDATRIGEIVARAFAEALAPTPGPVIVVLPEDMLEDSIEASVVEPLAVPRAGSPSAQDLDAILARLAKAERPLLIAGGGALGTRAGRQALKAASEAHQLPVALTFKRQDYFPNTHPHYVGHLGFKMPKVAIDRYLASDLILAVGTRLGEATTQGYTLPQSPHPRQPLIHVHDDARQLGPQLCGGACPDRRSDRVSGDAGCAGRHGVDQARPMGQIAARSARQDHGLVAAGRRIARTWVRSSPRLPRLPRRMRSSSRTPAIFPAGCTGIFRSRASTP